MDDIPPLPGSTAYGHLLRNLVLFGRLLRALGLEITPIQLISLVEGLAHIDMRRREDVKNAARAVLVNQPEHLALFDRAFDLFWQARTEGELLELTLAALARQVIPEKKPGPQKGAPEDTPGNKATPEIEADDEPLPETVQTYSDREVLRYKDFSELSPLELAEIQRLLLAMGWELEQRRTRRKRRASYGLYLDLRRMLRQGLRYGGEPLRLAWRERQHKRRPLVVICDISGSMERYSRVLLKFIYVISNGLEKVEAFVFSTRLTRITRELKERNVDLALDQVTATVHDWAGGTRTGESLKTFNYRWGRRVLGQGAIVLLISDGWDRGDIQLLRREMNRLQLSCQRLVWLNPLLGLAGYQPLTRGMQAALPFIDDFVPVHNLKSLEELGALLERLGEYRPLRRQAGNTNKA